MEIFEVFSQGGDLESCGNLYWRDLLEKHEDMPDWEPDLCHHVREVPDATDVPVSPSSVANELCEVFSCCCDCEDVVPQFFSFS